MESNTGFAGDVIYVEKMDAAEGDKVVFDKVVFADSRSVHHTLMVLLYQVLLRSKEKKVVIRANFKPKKHSHNKKQGHRQPYTKVVIDSIA